MVYHHSREKEDGRCWNTCVGWRTCTACYWIADVSRRSSSREKMKKGDNNKSSARLLDTARFNS